LSYSLCCSCHCKLITIFFKLMQGKFANIIIACTFAAEVLKH
jgi:hypothetical protein